MHSRTLHLSQELIWYPVLIFVNTLGFYRTIVDDATSASLELELEGTVKSNEYHSEGIIGHHAGIV